MLILLYSDTNYVLDGFHAEFSVSDCPNNCTNRGKCIKNVCFCENYWGGRDCSRPLCPNNCGTGGVCGTKQCECHNGYSGQACSLQKTNPEGNRLIINVDACFEKKAFYFCIGVLKNALFLLPRWHWLAHSESGMTPRAAHTAVYISEVDSLYVFGGYNLNYVLSDLEIYRFAKSHWEDEDGNVLGMKLTNIFSFSGIIN